MRLHPDTIKPHPITPSAARTAHENGQQSTGHESSSATRWPFVLAGVVGAVGATVGLALEQPDLLIRLRGAISDDTVGAGSAKSATAAMGLVAQMAKMRGTVLKERPTHPRHRIESLTLHASNQAR